MTKKKLDKAILKLLVDSPRPLTTREISLKLRCAWHTADRYCLKLQLKGEVECFTIGKSTAWFTTTSQKKKK